MFLSIIIGNLWLNQCRIDQSDYSQLVNFTCSVDLLTNTLLSGIWNVFDPIGGIFAEHAPVKPTHMRVKVHSTAWFPCSS